tara:strand:+ start:1465 stop:1770 length:306 start_codon:yes stop_codon:yes gene_type:complete
MLRILCVEPVNLRRLVNSNRLFYCLKFARYVILHIGFFYVYFLARELLMCDLSNAEVFNRWKMCKKQTAKDYWYDFLKKRADRSYLDAQKYVDDMDSFFNK